jgi:hypothetical protein
MCFLCNKIDDSSIIFRLKKLLIDFLAIVFFSGSNLRMQMTRYPPHMEDNKSEPITIATYYLIIKCKKKKKTNEEINTTREAKTIPYNLKLLKIQCLQRRLHI